MPALLLVPPFSLHDTSAVDNTSGHSISISGGVDGSTDKNSRNFDRFVDILSYHLEVRHNLDKKINLADIKSFLEGRLGPKLIYKQ